MVPPRGHFFVTVIFFIQTRSSICFNHHNQTNNQNCNHHSIAARLKTIFLCKEDEPEEYGLIYEKERHIRFQSIEKPFEKAEAHDLEKLAESLFNNISNEELEWTVEHPFCRDKFTYKKSFWLKPREYLPDPNKYLEDLYNLPMLVICIGFIGLFAALLTSRFCCSNQQDAPAPGTRRVHNFRHDSSLARRRLVQLGYILPTQHTREAETRL